MLFLLHNWSIPVLVSFISSQMPSLKTLHLKGPCYGFAFFWLKKKETILWWSALRNGIEASVLFLIHQSILSLMHFIQFLKSSELNLTHLLGGKTDVLWLLQFRCNNQKTKPLSQCIVSLSFMDNTDRAAAASTLIVQWNFLQWHVKLTTRWWWDND